MSSDATSRITDAAGARALLSASAVRERARTMLALAREGKLDDWHVDPGRLTSVADYVAAIIRTRYPRLDPPMHSRWRHFVFSGSDLGREVLASRPWPTAAARARAAFDLAITSVLLDAGAGPGWRYHDAPTGLTATRSEGLALASLRWFASGGMSTDAREPLRADAEGLQAIDGAALSATFQVSASNALTGAADRAALLRRLGANVARRPELFAIADVPRPGGLFDALARRAGANPLPAAAILETVLDAFGPIWQGRPVLAGVPLGDCWLHPALQGASPADRYVPLHKLSQWLSYSLIEPLEEAGIEVTSIEGLTGLAEYRNGGLFVDLGALVPRDAAAPDKLHAVDDPFVVGWRTLTVALLDELAPLLRSRLGAAGEHLTLAQLLEGGTWAAGRELARARRADGGPPFRIASDGTVF